MKKLLALLLFCGWLNARAHLEYIRIEKIDVSGQYTGQIDFLLKNKSARDRYALLGLPDKKGLSYPATKDLL